MKFIVPISFSCTSSLYSFWDILGLDLQDLMLTKKKKGIIFSNFFLCLPQALFKCPGCSEIMLSQSGCCAGKFFTLKTLWQAVVEFLTMCKYYYIESTIEIRCKKTIYRVFLCYFTVSCIFPVFPGKFQQDYRNRLNLQI